MFLTRAKNPYRFFFSIGSNDSFTLTKKQFQVLKIAKFEFKVFKQYTMAYGQNGPNCDLLINFCTNKTIFATNPLCKVQNENKEKAPNI